MLIFRREFLGLYNSGQMCTCPQSSFEISADGRVSLDAGYIVEGINHHPWRSRFSRSIEKFNELKRLNCG